MNKQTTTNQNHVMGASQNFELKDGKMYLYVAVTRGPLPVSPATNTQVRHFNKHLACKSEHWRRKGGESGTQPRTKQRRGWGNHINARTTLESSSSQLNWADTTPKRAQLHDLEDNNHNVAFHS